MYSEIDYSKIVLTDAEKRILNDIQKHPGTEYQHDKIHQLRIYRLVYCEVLGEDSYGGVIESNKWHISHEGEQYLTYKRDQRKLLWAKSVWLPLLVSLATSLVTTILLRLL